MKPALLRLLGAAVMGPLIGLVPPTRGQDFVDETPTEALSDGAVAVAPDIIRPVPAGLEELARAGSPSAAVETYSRARLNVPDSLVVDHAYVRRMVELGAPDLCVSQAQRLTRNVPGDGVAWAVLAFNSARENDFGTALAQLARAARYEPSHTFVQRIGGQLLAWYDAQAGPFRLPATMREAARDIRGALAGTSGFAEAYREASQYYRESADSLIAAPAAVEPAPALDVTTYDPGYVDYGYSYSPYPVYGGSYVGYPWYSGGSPAAATSVTVAIDRSHWRRYDRRDRPSSIAHSYHGSPDGGSPDHRRGATVIIRRGGGHARPVGNSGAVPRAGAGVIHGSKRSGTPGLKPPHTPGPKSPTPSHHGGITRTPQVSRTPGPGHAPRSAAPAPRPAAVPRQGPRGRGR
jgi:hypothetical protein